MAKVIFTPNIQRHVALAEAQASGATVREVLENIFADNPPARGYVLDTGMIGLEGPSLSLIGDDRVRRT